MKHPPARSHVGKTEQKYITAIRAVNDLIELYSQALVDERFELSPTSIARGSIILQELEPIHEILCRHRKLVAEAHEIMEQRQLAAAN